MNTSAVKHLHEQVRLLWGARDVPFAKEARAPFAWDGFEQARLRLDQAIALKCSGVLTAGNGIGKSFLLAHVLGSLAEKQYIPLHIHHTSMTGGDLLRTLCFLLGHKPRFRRSDTLELIAQCWNKLDGRFPLLVIDEAQNLSATALEELRLLGCSQLDRRALFALILCGDNHLLARLRMGVNRALLSRMGFHVQLQPMSPNECQRYIAARLGEAAMAGDVFDPAACQLLWQASDGAPRAINLLARQALQDAANEGSKTITANHVQNAIAALPWFAPSTMGSASANLPGG